MPSYRGNYNNNKSGMNSVTATLNKEELLEKYLKEFRVEQCPLFLQHKCQQHRPFTCFNWHFQNQRRRRPVRRRDGTFAYSADVYCTKYDETTGLCPDGDDCPYLHRTAGDTERRYHLKYYKTGMCVHDTDNRGFCVKNGPHCAFAHGSSDLRPPVYDIRELQAIENGETDTVNGLNNLDKERNLLNDDPKWLDTTYVLANYKTEPCKKPPRLCRQGYACPQFHNNKDKRRSPKKFKYRSTPCPQVKSGDEWGDPVGCDAGENCQYCHTRTEQQFHPEIYKSTKCNDIQNTSYCPRGAFCAFAHVEQETVSLESPSPPLSSTSESNNMNNNNHLLPENNDNNKNEISSSNSSNNLTSENGSTMGFTNHRAPGSQRRNGSITPPFEENGIASPIESNSLLVQQQQQQHGNSINSLGTSMDSALMNGTSINNNNSSTTTNGQTNNLFAKNRFLSGDHVREAMLRRQVYSIESDPTLNPVEKAQRKSSLIMELNRMSPPVTSSLSNGHVTSNNNSSNGQTNNSYGGFYNPSSFNGESLDSMGIALEDLVLDSYENSKSRKSSGFSETGTGSQNSSGNKSRQNSGYDNIQQQQQQQQFQQQKSRNCSGGSSISQGLERILDSGSNPMMIPGSSNSGNSPGGNSPVVGMMQQQNNGLAENGHSFGGVNQLGLFDLTASSPNNKSHMTPSSNMDVLRDLEIKALREELAMAREKINSFDETFAAARNACELWKKESTMTAKKAEMATKEKELMAGKLAILSKEVQQGLGQQQNGGSYLHAVKRVSELPSLPKGVLKTIEWQLKKDLMEVEKAMKQHESVPSGGSPWLTGNNHFFDFSSSSSNSDWGLSLIQPNTNHLF